MLKFSCKHILLFAKSLQSCPTLSDPIDGSPPSYPVPGTLQARTLEWVVISFSNAWKWKVKLKSLSCVRLLSTPWTAAYQAPPSMGFSRQEYWSGVPLPSPQIHWDTQFNSGYWRAGGGVRQGMKHYCLMSTEFQFDEKFLEMEMATHSSVLSWRIPAVYGVAQSWTRLKWLCNEFDYSRDLNKWNHMICYNMCSFVPGLFYLACFKLPPCCRMCQFLSFQRLNHNPLFVYATFGHPSIHPSIHP